MSETLPYNKYSKAVVICAALLTSIAVSACGGGGDDSDDDIRFDGTWTGSFTLTANTCNTTEFPQTLSFSHAVTQNDDAVELNASDGLRYLGNRVGSSGFSVDVDGNNSAGCGRHRRIEYDDINDVDDNAAHNEYHITDTCTNGSECEVAYTGTASRINGPSGNQPTPIPTTGTGPTPTPGGPVTGGCAAMNPRTASGVFEGDGGCGFSETALSLSSQGGNSTMVLNPLGANGLTTFVINSGNPATASSIRQDLTVKGDSGYNCNATCSPPGTFTLTCAKEGATQCVEKF